MSAARIDSAGNVTPLDGKAGARAVLTAEDAKDADKMARLVAGLLDDVAELRRRHAPRRIDFEDITTTSGGTVRLHHGFGGPVVWWLVDYQIIGGAAAPVVQRDTTNSDSDTLVLLTYSTGITTIRVEAAS